MALTFTNPGNRLDHECIEMNQFEQIISLNESV